MKQAALAALVAASAGAKGGRALEWEWRGAPATYLGVTLVETTDQLRAALGVKDDRGALVMSVEKGSPAESAGLRAGDVIVRVAGSAVGGTDDVLDAIEARKAGDEIDVMHVRGGAVRKTRVKLAERPDAGAFSRRGVGPFRFQHGFPEEAWKRLEQLPGDLDEKLDRRFRELEERLRKMEERLGKTAPPKT